MSKETKDNSEEIAKLANHMQKSKYLRFWYVVMRGIMFIESIVWTIADVLRALRERVAGKINANYQRNTSPSDRV